MVIPATDITWNCDINDEWQFSVYSFPQNTMQTTTRTNIRAKDAVFDTSATYSVTLGGPVANMTFDDPRIEVSTVDNTSFILTNVPDTVEELWFQFDYTEGNYFGSNMVGVTVV